MQRCLFLLAALSVTLFPPQLGAALNAYLQVTGETQGEIQGSSTASGREGHMEIYGWSHEVVAPRDAASGLPTGKRQHKPITVTKPVDKATPLLMRALTTNENLPEVQLRAWRPVGTAGAEEHYFTITLINATVVGVRQEMLDNRFPENSAVETREHVSFTYQRIVWTFEEGGVTAEDDWETPTSG